MHDFPTDSRPPIRILTVRQPWASLIVMGFKPVENRSWRTSYRGPVAILAGQGIDLGDRAQEAAQRHLQPGGKLVTKLIKSLPRCGIVGLVDLYDVVTSMPGEWFYSGPVGLLVRAPRSLSALLPMSGSLGLVRAKPGETEAIYAALEPTAALPPAPAALAPVS